MRLISYHLGEAGQPYWYFLLQNWGERSLHQHIEHLMHWKIPCEIDKQTEHTWLPNRTESSFLTGVKTRRAQAGIGLDLHQRGLRRVEHSTTVGVPPVHERLAAAPDHQRRVGLDGLDSSAVRLVGQHEASQVRKIFSDTFKDGFVRVEALQLESLVRFRECWLERIEESGEWEDISVSPIYLGRGFFLRPLFDFWKRVGISE